MHSQSSLLATKADYQAFALEKSFCSFLYLISLLSTHRVLTVKEMLTCFVFYEYLAAAEKENKQETSEVFLSVSLEWLNKVLFGKEICLRARA